jgi:hypothetical protein
MQCEEFEDRLNVVLDERKRPEADAELRLHCETCPECRQMAAAYGLLLDGFCALVSRDATTDMAVRVLAEMQPPVLRSRRWSVATATRSTVALATGALALAAGLLIAIVPLARWSSQTAPTRSQVQGTLAAHSLTSSGPSPAVMLPVDLKRLPIVRELLALRDEHEDPYAELAKESGQGLARAVLFVPGIGGSKSIVSLAEAKRPSDPAWAVQLSEGLRPISDSVAATFSLMLRSVPVSVADSRS